jgi:hypothetical protein
MVWDGMVTTEHMLPEVHRLVNYQLLLQQLVDHIDQYLLKWLPVLTVVQTVRMLGSVVVMIHRFLLMLPSAKKSHYLMGKIPIINQR